MRNISNIFYIFSLIFVFSCSELAKKSPVAEPTAEPITGTVEELKAQVDALDKRLEHELEVIGQYQYNYMEIREKMVGKDMFEHAELKPLLMEFRAAGIDVVKGTNLLMAAQGEKITTMTETSKKNIYSETISLYKNQINTIEAAKPGLDKFVVSLEKLYSKVTGESVQQ